MSAVVTMIGGESGNLSLEIESHLGLSSGEPLVLIKGDDFVLVKKTAFRSPIEKFDNLATGTRERFDKLGLTEEDVKDAVAWARASS